MDWQVNPARDVHNAQGFLVEPTGNPGEYALYRTEPTTGRQAMWAEMTGTLEECQRAAESIDPNTTTLQHVGEDDDDEEGPVSRRR